jgi:glutamate-5-semialdehyde dehydrogenase
LRALQKNDINKDIFALTHKREDVEVLLSARGIVDLIIPRGSNELVQYIMSNTQIPVLGHSAGVCHIYVDESADLEKALRICIDAKTSYPAACNAAETILVHKTIAAKFLPLLLQSFETLKVESRCDEATRELIKNGHLTMVRAAEPADFGREFTDLIVACRVVESLDQAIQHINEFSSNHTEAIITEDQASAERFFEEVDSAGVYQNASTRFADGFRYGFGAEVGISNGKLHPRGPVGLDGLTTYKYRLVGTGQIVADYTGANGRPFLHKDLTP